MSKKRVQKVEISNEELKPTVLFTIKERKASFLGVIIVFALFIAVVYFLPQATELYEKYTKKEEVNNSGVVTNKPTDEEKENPDQEPEVVDEKYIFADNLTIENKDFIINNFSFNNNTLVFNVTNAKEKDVNLKSKKYYLEIYNTNNTLVKRIKIAEDEFMSKETKNYNYPINSSTIGYFYLKEIAIDNYPNINLTESEEGATLTCSLNQNIIIYTFKNNELKSITSTITVNNTESDYANQISTYQALATTYNTYPGVESNLSSMTDGFVFNTAIDLTKANINNFNNLNFYARNTKPNVINFEVEARGYNCN